MWRPTPLQRNILIILAAGLAVRIVLGLFWTYPRDIASWAVNSENYLMGEGLYGLPGHYYTPVWGYVMSVLTAIVGFAGIPVNQYVTDFTGSTIAYPWYTSLPTLEYAMVIKAFLFIVDILVAYSVFRIAMHITGDERKSTIATAIWFLFPLTIVMSSIRVMFENLEILFMLLSLLMLLERRPELAGAMMGISLLVKPYGMFLGILMIGYAFAQTGSLRYTARYVVSTLVAGLVLMAPVVLSGQLDEALHWLSVRAGNVGSGYNRTLVIMPILIAGSMLVALLTARFRWTDPKLLITFALIFTGGMLVMPGNVQYYLLLLPLAALMFSRWALPILALLLLLSFYSGVSFSLWSAQLYITEQLPGWEAIRGIGEFLYPYESTLNYNTEKSITGYAAVLLPLAALYLRWKGGAADS